MDQTNVWEDYAALPVEAQEKVAEYISFLRSRYPKQTADQQRVTTNLAAEAFIGMWADRTDLSDSTKWVRKVRRQEWRELDG